MLFLNNLFEQMLICFCSKLLSETTLSNLLYSEVPTKLLTFYL